VRVLHEDISGFFVAPSSAANLDAQTSVPRIVDDIEIVCAANNRRNGVTPLGFKLRVGGKSRIFGQRIRNKFWRILRQDTLEISKARQKY